MNDSALPTPTVPTLPSSYALDAPALFSLTAPYCRSLGRDGYAPFFALMLDLLPQMPAALQTRARQVAREILVDTAFEQLARLEDLESTLVDLLKDMPATVGKALAQDVKANAAATWNILLPSVQKMIAEQMEPQRLLLESVYGTTKDTWLALPSGPERLRAARDTCRTRADTGHADARDEPLAWIASVLEELAWTWDILRETASGARELFAAEQAHLLIRALRAVYQPKCPPPCLPMQQDAYRSLFLPLAAEAQAAQEQLDIFLRERLEAVVILPQAGSPFLGARHDAPAAFWRPARTPSEQPNTICDVREAGLERQGRVLVKATVGIFQSPPEAKPLPTPPAAASAPVAAPPAPETPPASMLPSSQPLSTMSPDELSDIRMPD